MTWIAIGGAGDSYPASVRALRGKSGVYAIRTKPGIFFGPKVLYVGESHTGNLYQTLTRHFQRWNRGKDAKWYAGHFEPKQTDPGHTYDRGGVEVTFKVATPARALLHQTAWIRRFRPRDNHAGNYEDAPF